MFGCNRLGVLVIVRWGGVQRRFVFHGLVGWVFWVDVEFCCERCGRGGWICVVGGWGVSRCDCRVGLEVGLFLGVCGGCLWFEFSDRLYLFLVFC